MPGECLDTPKVEDAADYDVASARFPITNSFGDRAPARATLGRLATSMPMAAGREPPSLADAIVSGGSLSIIRADGGVGKSVLSMQLGEFFPTGSQTFVYDCFGNGGYRNASGYRHRCRDGLVQLANEMAGCGLADPLVPSGKAEPSAYIRAFKARAKQAADKVASEAPNALLCIIIDAADSAQIAADALDSRALRTSLTK